MSSVLTEHGFFDDPQIKFLLFTEHKDTLDYLTTWRAAGCRMEPHP